MQWRLLEKPPIDLYADATHGSTSIHDPFLQYHSLSLPREVATRVN